MKIALLAYHLRGVSGIARHILRQAREMTDMGHEVDVWAMEYDPEKCYPELTQDVHVQAVFPMGQSGARQADDTLVTGARMAAYLADMRRRFRIQQQMFEKMPAGYDVVNPHGHTVNWAAAMYKRKYGVPVIWLSNDFWVPGGSRIEHPKQISLKRFAKQALTFSTRRYDHQVVRELDGVVVLSDLIRQQIRQEYGVDAAIIPTGVDPIKTDREAGRDFRRRYGFRDETFVVTTVAMLMERRRSEDVIRAVHRLVTAGRDVGYLIVGKESFRPDYVRALKDEVARLNLLDRVKFAGEVPGADLDAALNAGDAFVWAADATQSWGMACLEAMTAGVPGIVSRANGLAEALTHEANALLYLGENPDDLAAQITRLIDDAALRGKISAAGQQLAIEKYSWRGNAESMLALFRQAQR